MNNYIFYIKYIMGSEWAVWLVIIILLLACLGIIIWFAIDSSISGNKNNIDVKSQSAK